MILNNKLIVLFILRWKIKSRDKKKREEWHKIQNSSASLVQALLGLYLPGFTDVVEGAKIN